MKLDRNENADGSGKYALLKLRRLEEYREQKPFGGLVPEIASAIAVLEREGLLDSGTVGTDREFFVIRLRDKYAAVALGAYASAAQRDDPEYAAEITELASRAGLNSPFCKRPD